VKFYGEIKVGVLFRKAINFVNDWKENTGHDCEKADVSIIIPAYYPEHMEAVVRHLNAIGGMREIIIVDDSGKGILKRRFGDEEFHNVHIVCHEKNLGRPAARNTGAVNASGDILVFMDQDMFLNPDFLNQVIGLFSANAGHAVVLGLRDTVDFSDIPAAGRWISPSPEKDWRRQVVVTDEMTDLTAAGTGGVSNRCSRNQKLKIYEESRKLRGLGMAPDKTLGFWDLASMVISHSMAVSRDDFLKTGGFPEWICGWGGEDIAVGFLCVAAGIPVILTEAVSYQAKHQPYSGTEAAKSAELRQNIKRYRAWANEISEFPAYDRNQWLWRGKPEEQR